MADAPPQADQADGCPHPRDTHDLIGHERAETTFLKAIEAGRMHHAWLITGLSGVGKSTLAYRMIRHLLGGRSLLSTSLDIPADDPVSGRISAQGHGNLFVLRRPYDPKSKRIKTEIPVSEIRRMTEFFHETASEEGRFRIGLIDKADELNVSSENAVLKLLEEPPQKGMLILLADAPGRLLPTIRSRCMSLDLRPVDAAQLSPWLSARTDLSPDQLDKAVWLSRGSPGRAMAMAGHLDSVLSPIANFAGTLAKRAPGNDVPLVSQLALPKAQTERALFWGALQDLLSAAAAHSAGAPWTAPFPEPRQGKWSAWWEESVARERIESEINMDKRAALLDLLTGIRAA